MEKYQFTEQERALMESLRIPFAIYQFIDKRVVTLVLTDGFLDMFGYDDRKAGYDDMNNDMYKFTHPDDVSRIADAAFRFATEGGSYDVIYRAKKDVDSDYFLVHAKGEHIYPEDGVRLAQVWYTDEGPCETGDRVGKQELKQELLDSVQEESILKASSYDYLTGLPSMSYFFELADAGRDNMMSEGDQHIILYMDISNMKFFNRKYCFYEGDELLRSFAQILVRYFSNENCSRFAQDHFVVYTKEKGLEDTLRHIFKDFKEVCRGENMPIRVGIYRKTVDSVTISTACDRAKAACDTLKHTSVSAFCYFKDAMQEEEDRKRYIINNFDRALREKWITVYYQPIVRATNGRVCDEEALARWIDPQKGFLSPADFIPILEEAHLSYKLDLYVLDQVLAKLDTLKKAGLVLVPQSVNLSRSDFDSCDMVEEIRERVDKAGIGRDLITIEITESVIGRDLDFMKMQVERFSGLGFPVWMDDFGSGYSSLDLLQTLHFDLIKFDMQFMRQFNVSDKSKIMLTELMKMATAMGIDTVCEGVETLEQVEFLREIGCSKLQGYYYAKPIPLQEILNRYEKGLQIGFENPAESGYYETVGRVNLYDLAVISQEDENQFQNFFNTLPMAILEVADGKIYYIRSNQSYRAFLTRRFGFDVSGGYSEFSSVPVEHGTRFMNMISHCCQNGNRAFIDEKLNDGTTVHLFIRRIAVNPVTKAAAVAVAVLAIIQDNKEAVYQNIARAMVADYFNIFYVDLDTEKFIEYTSNAGEEYLEMERHGEDFFNRSRQDARRILYKADQDTFIAAFTKENIVDLLDKQGTFNLIYRLAGDESKGEQPVYVTMKAMRMQGDGNHIAIGVRNVDTQMRQKETIQTMKRDQVAYARINALAGNYICLYTVDPESGQYIEYSSSTDYQDLGLLKQGDDFFGVAQAEGDRTIYTADLPAYRKNFNMENVLKEINESGMYVMHYRLMMDNVPVFVELRAALHSESDGTKLIVGIKRIDKRYGGF